MLQGKVFIPVASPLQEIRYQQRRELFMKPYVKVIVLVLVFVMFTCAAFGAGLAVGGSGWLFPPGVVRAADQPAQFDTFWQVWNIVQRSFVDKEALDPTQMTYGAIQGMLTALGDEGHTAFLSPEDVARHQTDISGTYSGIGAQIGVREGLPVIVAPFDGSPAAEAGVKAGDIIIEVNGEDVTTMPLRDIVDRIRGEAGTEVTLTLLRPEESKSLEITVTRGEIDSPTATWGMLPGTNVALIRLSRFSADATEEITEALREAEEAGATALVVDVRGNPGGLLEQAIKVTSQFLEDGNVLQQEDAEGNRKVYPVEPGGIATDIPMVVLINRGTASSSEIFAGAMQDYERAQVVGETTFGTGTVLEPFPLDDGSLLMLGTSQWLTAEGRLIRKNGIEPDVMVEIPIETEIITPETARMMPVEELRESEDLQVLKALELLGVTPED
jgi:carboxyl-terminal processing protease